MLLSMALPLLRVVQWDIRPLCSLIPLARKVLCVILTWTDSMRFESASDNLWLAIEKKAGLFVKLGKMHGHISLRVSFGLNIWDFNVKGSVEMPTDPYLVLFL